MEKGRLWFIWGWDFCLGECREMRKDSKHIIKKIAEIRPRTVELERDESMSGRRGTKRKGR